ncbi:FAD-dependent oxidoreductase [Zafaria sp. J156]|uniref:FAD-dependent oxidoreductase n=1 Tax=Zafaria sp. J156 TaxID=3116490 RepID=UPI003FCEA225
MSPAPRLAWGRQVVREVVVVGSGQSGLLVARKLAAAGVGVTCVERLPEPGGQEPEPETRRMAQAAGRAGVKWLLGTLAFEYRDRSVRTLGVNGARTLAAEALVLATGSRPATRAELGIAGDRGAGVLPGSVVHHYLDSGVLPGRYPVVVGDGQLAATLCSQLLRSGAAHVTSIRSKPGEASAFPGTLTHWNSVLEAVEGFPRTATAIVRQAGESIRIPTDAVVLAARRIPMRNVENAVGPSRAVIDCFSSADPKSVEDAEATADAAFHRVLAELQ